MFLALSFPLLVILTLFLTVGKARTSHFDKTTCSLFQNKVSGISAPFPGVIGVSGMLLMIIDLVETMENFYFILLVILF